MNAPGSPSFLDGLDAEARALLLSVARAVAYDPSAVLVRQGDAARGAYILEAGAVEAIVTLPGSESVAVATLGPGSVLGEMALIELGTCTATVRAASRVTGWFVAHEDFRALVTQAHPAALRLQHAVTAALAAKVSALNQRMLACAAPEDRPARMPEIDPLAAVERGPGLSFAAAAFLPQLTLFQRFSAVEIEEVAALGRYLQLPRGHGVFSAGSPAGAVFVVVRGAVEIVCACGDLERRMAVVGPGQLVGYLSVLREAEHTATAYTREASVLLEIPAGAFHAAYFGPSRASARLRHAVQVNLLLTLARTNRALTRLLSLEQLSSPNRPDAALEAAYHAQLATASPL